MYRKTFLCVSAALMMGSSLGCSTTDNRGERQPASFSRAGRQYKEPKAMNHRRTDPDSVYSACVRERSEMYCRNRMGR